MHDLFPLVPVTAAWHEWTFVPPIGIEIHARTWTAATPTATAPLVLVAGLGVSSRYWLRLGRRLASRFHVLAPDLPGFGKSPRPPGVRWPAGPTVDEQADELLAWMDARRLARVTLCGHSTGGQVVVHFATRYPERVERVILIAPTFDPRHRRLLGYLPRLLIAGAVEAPSLTPLLCFEYLSAGLPRVIQQAVRFLRDPVEAKLPGLRQPTLVIAGQYDTLVPRHWTDRVAARLPHALGVSIDHVGHAPQFSAPAVTASAIGDFLDGRLDVACPPADGVTIAPIDDPRHDPLGPPQPLGPRAHAVLDYALAIAAVVLPRRYRWGSRPRRVLTSAAVISTASTLVSDHPLAVSRAVPMLAHANGDVVSGATLMMAAVTILRREKSPARWATAAIGFCQIASAVLMAKPTGPARVRAAVRPASGHRRRDGP